jgi:hypothetical protein
MNERIKGLAEEALKTSMVHDGMYRPEGYANGVSKDFADKFAELIVRECATIILNNDIEKQEDYGVNHLFFNGWERGVIDSCQIIKKHFGVEE